MDILTQVASYAQETYPQDYSRHIAEVVSYVRQLAAKTGADAEIAAIAAYFHDISRVSMGAEEHNLRSAEMARAWLSEQGYPAERIDRVAAAIVAHMLPARGQAREAVPMEGRILYDADKIARASGLPLLSSLVRLGQHVSSDDVTYQHLATAVRKGRQTTEEAYHSLYTEAARELAEQGFRRTLEFCDQILMLDAFEGAR